MGHIKRWRPESFNDFVGQDNARPIRRLQDQAKKRTMGPTLILGPYGSAKTSLARLLMKSFCCQSPNRDTADPCHLCEGCLRQGPEYNGEVHTFRHWEIDCTLSIGRKEMADLVTEARQERSAALYFDELFRLSVRSAQHPLLKFTEDLQQGLILASAALDGKTYGAPGQLNMIPPLFERMRKVYLTTPTVEEMVTFLLRKAPEWGVDVEAGVLRELVARADRSFRTCLDVLDAAFENAHHALDQATLDEFLPASRGDLDSYDSADRGDPDTVLDGAGEPAVRSRPTV